MLVAIVGLVSFQAEATSHPCNRRNSESCDECCNRLGMKTATLKNLVSSQCKCSLEDDLKKQMKKERKDLDDLVDALKDRMV